ncbi:hypothetical protein Y695_03657 [Hydrogenophaga sp. T4]|nr:hypothetical protein Y695_03657 [Hydrogenophaga sp. T4]
MREARREPDRHWQRHRQPRDRQTGRRPDQADPEGHRCQPPLPRHAEGGGERGGRFGVFRERIRLAGNARRGREPARCRFHRAPPAGPAGRAGEDRPQEHWRGPVPARREPERTRAHAGSGGRRLCERCGRGPQHRQRAAAVARFGPLGHGGEIGGALARGQRRVQEPPAIAGCDRPGCQDLRTKRGLPAHPRRRQPAGHDRCAPGNLSGGRADHGPDWPAGGRAHGPRRHAQDAASRAVRQ